MGLVLRTGTFSVVRKNCGNHIFIQFKTRKDKKDKKYKYQNRDQNLSQKSC